MSVIEIQNVTKRYKEFTLEGITFDVPEGKIVGLVGENGAGKTTLIRAIMGSCRLTDGSIRVWGEDNKNENHFSQLKQSIGVVLDEGCLPIVKVSVLESVFKAAYVNWDHECFMRLVREYELPLNKKVNQISRGQKMKLALALALSHKPRLLILDEPTGGLDPMVREEIIDSLKAFVEEDPSRAILFSSHIISDMEKICDSVVYIHRGRMLFAEDKQVLMARAAEKNFSNLEEYIISVAKEVKKNEKSAY